MIGGHILTESADKLLLEEGSRLVTEDFVADTGGGRGHVRRYIPVRFKDEKEDTRPPKVRRRELKQPEIEARIAASAEYVAAGSPTLMSRTEMAEAIREVPAVASILEIDRARVERSILRYIASLLDEEEEEAMALLLAA